MRIINKTKNKVLSESAILANKPFARVRGLLGRKEFKWGEAIVLRPCNSIHTLFMKFPIDVLFVDKNNRVVKAIIELKPFRLTPVYFKSSFVIELPVGTLLFSLTEEGDELQLF